MFRGHGEQYILRAIYTYFGGNNDIYKRGVRKSTEKRLIHQWKHDITRRGTTLSAKAKGEP